MKKNKCQSENIEKWNVDSFGTVGVPESTKFIS